MAAGEHKTALVIGAGIAGLEAAKTIGQAGGHVIIVEKESLPGGMVRRLVSSFPRWDNPADILAKKLKEVQSCPLIAVETGVTVKSSARSERGFDISLEDSHNDIEKVETDAVIIATGAEPFDASIYGEYGYGYFPNVLNSLDFEKRLQEWKTGQGGTPPQTVAFIKCVGSRDRSKGYPYCSKICCMITAKQAGLVKDLRPDTKCYVFYTDYRAGGKGCEEFVRSVIEKKHVRYIRGRPAKVLPEDGRLLIRAEDTLMGVPVEVRADMIVLATALQSSSSTRDMAAIFGLESDPYGFLEPLPGEAALVSDRVFAAGACIFPLDIQSALQQGAAAGAGVIALFNRDR